MVQSTLIPTLESFLAGALPAHLELLRQMVQINSFTANSVGVNEVGRLTAASFANLGFAAEYVQAEEFIYGKHLILTREARNANGRVPPCIGLISHLDTVYPAGEEIDNDFFWRESGHRIYGPGVYDIKGGTIMIHLVLSAVQALLPALYDQVTWIGLLNAAEEALVPDFGRLCLKYLPPTALAALVFEGGEAGHNGQADELPLVVSRKGMARYQLTVEGKAAHAGSSHAQGANAILQMADVIQQIASFTDYGRDLTFNVGTIAGGTVINRVPHQASAAVEMRAFTPEVFDTAVARMADLDGYSSVRSSSGAYPCRVSVNKLGQWSPWPRNEKSDGLLAIWQEVAAELALSVRGQERGGLSDGNWTWQQVPTIDGLGPEGGNAHCSERSEDGSKDQEYILPASYVPRARLNVLAIARLLAQAGIDGGS